MLTIKMTVPKTTIKFVCASAFVYAYIKGYDICVKRTKMSESTAMLCSALAAGATVVVTDLALERMKVV